MINVDIIHLIVIILTVLIASIIYFLKKKPLNRSYISFIVFSALAGTALYAGAIWIIKPLNIILDVSIYDSPLYNVLVGLILIVSAIIVIREEIKKE